MPKCPVVSVLMSTSLTFCSQKNCYHCKMNRCLCSSSVLATMKRRLPGGSETLHDAKRAHEDSSSDDESQLSRQGRFIDVKNNFKQSKREDAYLVRNGLCGFFGGGFTPGMWIFQIRARMIPSATRMISGQDFHRELQPMIQIVTSSKPPPVSQCTTVFHRDSW